MHWTLDQVRDLDQDDYEVLVDLLLQEHKAQPGV